MSPRAVLEADRFSASQLVLTPSETVDPAVLNLDAYDEFIDTLTEGRHYQRSALENAMRFLCSGRYGTTADLAREAYRDSPDLQRRYSTVTKLIERLPFAEMLSCSIDLATGTGKSYVHYGIARMMLNEGIVDRVLVLCPSLTIEEGLHDKFVELMSNSDLTDLLPDRPGVRVPEITDASSTVQPGQICIENIHAVFETTGSSIRDSFTGSGERTLVLSDEAHHIYSAQGDRDIRLWKEFVADPKYAFHYHVGASGTCYVGNDYFADVVYRYSIGQAMEEHAVKEVYYLAEDDSATDYERYQKLLAQHEQNRATYKMKPLTIAVTRNIAAAEELAEDLTAFLAERVPGARQEAEAKVLVVTSSPKHEANVRKLRTVDDPSNPAEWIVSVAMLTEGWDVKNVFQIYPHEKRAFNSKLLIAQVLGRGLRIQRQVSAGVAQVLRVFNHQRWGAEVSDLVAEVIDQDTEITQHPAERDSAAHFKIHDLTFENIPTGIQPSPIAVKDITRLTVHPQRDATEETKFLSARDPSRVDVLTTRVVEKLYDLDDVVREVRRRLLDYDKNAGADIAEAYPRMRIEKLIRDAFQRIDLRGDKVSQENRQIILSSFGSLCQTTSRAGAILTNEPTGLTSTDTADMRVVRGRVSAVTSHLAVFYDEESNLLGTSDDVAALRKIIELDEKGDVRPFLYKIANGFLFKSPVNVVLTSHKPERLFVAHLFQQENAAVISSWIKAPDTGFYAIEYSYQGNAGGTKRGSFNPDFFVLLGNGDVIVVETKEDEDNSPRNVGKLKYGSAHFERINGLLGHAGEERRYQFHFVSPSDYPRFFDALRAGDLDSFVSALQGTLKP